MKKSEKETNKWKDTLCSWIGNIHITPINQQIQYNPHQNSNGIIHRNRTNNPKICKESQKNPSSQSNLEKEEQNWRPHVS